MVLAFAPGERLEYDVRCGPLRLGELTLTTLALDTVSGESCYSFRAVLEAKLGFLFHATYDIRTWCRTEDMVTMRSAKETRESRYEARWTADYDYEAGRVVYSDGDTFPLPDSARDVLTLWYWFRTLETAVGDTQPVYCHTDRRDYEPEFIATKRTDVAVPVGEFDCLELIPSPGSPLGALYLADMETDSGPANRIPVVIRTDIGGVQVSAVLRSIGLEERE